MKACMSNRRWQGKRGHVDEAVGPSGRERAPSEMEGGMLAGSHDEPLPRIVSRGIKSIYASYCETSAMV